MDGRAGRSPTMADVAKAAGTSRALVSIAFRGVKGVSRETRDRIFAVAAEMGYRPNVVASRLASKTTVTVGVFLLDLYNEIFADIYEGVRSTIGADGRHIVLAVGSGSETDSDNAGIQNLMGARADVIIAAGLMMPDTDVLGLNRSTPIVSASRSVLGVDSAFSDDKLGAKLAVDHLVELGHRRIAHLASIPREGYTGRRDGYGEAMTAHNLATQVVEASYRQVDAARVAGQLLDSTAAPTAIFANNDVAALGVMDALDARGLRVGEDVSLVGYDNTPVSQLPAISLTSVDLHAEHLGVAAAELALARLADPARDAEHVTSAPNLVARRSTQPPRTH